MAKTTKKYLSFDKLAIFFTQLKSLFATKSELSSQISTKANLSHTHKLSDITNLESNLNNKANQTSLDTHTSDSTVHIDSSERTKWNNASTHSSSVHAPSNAEKNQNAFSNFKVGNTIIAADNVTDTLNIVGSNVTVSGDATNDQLTISVSNASTSTKGIVQLTDSTSSSSTSTAATPKNVKAAYDLANSAKSIAQTAQTTADSKANATHSHDLNAMINTLTEGSSTPSDTDYYISQYANGGADTTTYHRRPVSALWAYMKNKTDSLYQPKGNYETTGTAQSKADTALSSAKSYTDTKIANLVGSAPETMDTLEEVATAIAQHQSVTDALNSAIGTKAAKTDLTSHTGNKSNPHGVTKEQVGLGNVPNVATNDQTPSYSDTTTFATLVSGEKLSVAFPKIKLAITNLINHIANKSNPHSVTKAQLGLANVNNTSDADKPISTAMQTALNNKSNTEHTHDYLPLSGGTLTGNLTGQYFTGSWLQTTASSNLTSKPNKIAVLDESGWIYYRTPAQILSDIGAAASGHTHSGYVNQNAFSNIAVGSSTIAADSATDTLTLVAGSNITLTPDTTNDKVTIAATNTVYTHPNSGVSANTYKSVTVDAQGHVTGGSNPTTLSGYGITDAASKTHNHSATNITSGTLPITRGGTESSTASGARTNLGITYGTDVPTEVPTTGEGSIYFMADDGEPLGIEEGGTGATTASGAISNLGMMDYIVEQGTSDSWIYRKWNSGIAECWKNSIATGTTTMTAANNVYYSDPITFSIPDLFSSITAEFYSPKVNNVLSFSTYSRDLTNNTISIRVKKSSSDSSTSNFAAMIIGKWK